MPMELGQPIGQFLLAMAALMPTAIPLRIVLGWMYNVTGGSILIVAILLATFNATNNTQLLTAAAPAQLLLAPGDGAVHLVILAWAFAVLTLTRGRLGEQQNAWAEAST
jgi:hypothetical protein